MRSTAGDDGETRLPGDSAAMTTGDRSGAAAAGPSLTVGQSIGSYRIERLLGAGGMGEVYEAEHLESGRRVALKVLTRALGSREASARFLREGRLAASVSHPNCVYVFGSEEESGTPIIAMELVSGGTLQERVDRDGPMRPTDAVDAILQVVDGLEAAEAAGVLHRDIKPSNCFVGVSGSVKVGDFGLSRSTMGTDQTQLQLTMLGTFMGTPAFASPEQVRGDPIDVRSDIYSVGATLYFLLTGRTPFAKVGVMQMLAAVLGQAPESPRQFNRGIPDGLADVVLRCLQKDPAARFPRYAALRTALLPYSSAIAPPAALQQRFVAYLVDTVVMSPIALALVNPLRPPEALSLTREAAAVLSGLVYFGFLEGIWGASLGKRVCGLRIVAGSERPGLARAGLRVLVFSWLSIALTLWRAVAGGTSRMASPWGALLTAGTMLLFITARRRNGYAGVHDLVSGTRVVRRQAQTAATAVEPQKLSIATTGERRGPFLLLESQTHGPVLAAYDDVLKRQLWIHTRPPGAPLLPAARQGLGRTSRLRWLTSRRSATESWDAYEAVGGEPLGSRQYSWKQVRTWLYELARELEAAFTDGTLPADLDLGHVWITNAGTVKLLEFPAPAIAATGHDASGRIGDLASAQRFLHRFAVASLGHTPYRAGLPLPLGAERLLQRLAEGGYASFTDLIAAIQATLDRPVAATRGQRGAALAIAGFLPLMMILGSIVASIDRASDSRERYLMRQLLARLEELTRATAVDEARRRERDALRVHLAAEYRSLIEDDQVWGSLSMRGRSRPLARAVVAAHPAPTAGERASAARELDPLLDRLDQRFRRRPGTLFLASAVSAIVCAAYGVAALILAFAFRGGASLRLVGLAVVQRNGLPASRVRAFARAAVAWSPVLVAGGLMFGERRWPTLHDPVSMIAPALLAVFVAGLVFTILRPARGWQDRLAGTWVVPS